MNLKSLLGFDPAGLQDYVKSMAEAAETIKAEQVRLAEMQNVMARHAIALNDKLDAIMRELDISLVHSDSENDQVNGEDASNVMAKAH